MNEPPSWHAIGNQLPVAAAMAAAMSETKEER
jgi:hypothetical protein